MHNAKKGAGSNVGAIAPGLGSAPELWHRHRAAQAQHRRHVASA